MAPDRTMEACSGESSSGVDNPSAVVIALSTQFAVKLKQARAGSPPTNTEQAPQIP